MTTVVVDTAANTVDRIAAETHTFAQHWYAEWVDPADLAQEFTIYTETNRRRLERWVEKGEDHRVRLAYAGVAKQYGLAEKAAQSGYDFDDIAWYTPGILADIVPLAADRRWDGLTGESDRDLPRTAGPANEGGGLLAMVLDVRRAFDLHGYPAGGFDPETDLGESNLRQLADWLGGEFPSAPGYCRTRRQVVSNAVALSLTREQEA